MRSHCLRLITTLVLCVALIHTPFLKAAQLSLPAGDLVAPEVSHEIIPDALEAGSSVQIKATVTDNVGVESVTLFYRIKGGEDYKRTIMNRIGDTDDYAVTLGKEDLAAPGVEYYIQAMDFAGNSLLHGYSFFPLLVSVVAPTGTNDQAEEKVDNTIHEKPPIEKKKTNAWIWIGLGALAVGAIAAIAGSGGDDGDGNTSGTVVVSAPVPAK